ncbi:hypothetical protein POVCU2_0053590 [Plasmodium ovale curtisi]|uniref:Uncharacterized protein n=1 Tax=Plasmodium ovale curtisi TaxID=864141 RepID=A0A1A8W8E7_PLAOA|nr:hypothetical protein POVCU1_006390 [Plasmodium ovale curtisi]SBS89293.1 hypothetical protein POVCU2_0053590 [Plasmodium ovale curtisi]
MNSTSLDNDYFTHANQTLDKNEHNIDSDHIYTRIYPLCDMTISYSMYPKLQPACSNSSEDGISSNFLQPIKLLITETGIQLNPPL